MTSHPHIPWDARLARRAAERAVCVPTTTTLLTVEDVDRSRSACIDAYGPLSDACVECRYWRDLRHPLQSTCDDHLDLIRAMHRVHDARQREIWEAASLAERDARTRRKALLDAATRIASRATTERVTADRCAESGDVRREYAHSMVALALDDEAARLRAWAEEAA